MDFTFRVDPRPFAEAVAWVARRLPAKPPVPVLAGLLLELDDAGGLGLYAFDGDAGHYAALGVSAAPHSGRVLVSGRLLASLAKDLPDKPVQVTTEASRLLIRCGSVRLSLPTMPTAEYPTLPVLPRLAGTADAGELGAAIDRAYPASDHSDKHALPELTGINLVLGTALELWACDRYRAAIAPVPWKPVDELDAVEALVPAPILAETAKTFTTGDVAVHLGDGLAGFVGEDRSIITRLLAHPYPRLPTLFPATWTLTGEVQVADLVAALRRADQLRADKSPATLAFTPDLVTVSAAGDQGDSSEDVPCRFDGDAFTIHLNPGYLLDALAAVRSPRAELRMTGTRKPVLVAGTDDYRHLVVPIRRD